MVENPTYHTEMMTELFLHCGLVNDEWVIEVTNYQDSLKVLLHHLVMGNISTTQVTPVYHFNGIHFHMQVETLL